MATQTVAAGGGSWSSSATWAPGSVPATGDDVVLGTTSGQLTIDVNTNNIRSLVCTGYTGTITHNASVTLNIGTSTAPVGNIALLFVGTETYTLGNSTTSAIAITDTSAATNTYNFAGLTIGNLTINNGTTTTTQLTTSGFTTAGTVTLTQGGLNTNDLTCTWGSLAAANNNTKTLTLGASSITITSIGTSWAFNTTGTTFNAGTATVTITGTNTSVQTGVAWSSTSTMIFTGGGTCSIFGSSSLGNLTYTGTTNKSCELGFSNSLSILGNFTVNGNSYINRVFVAGFSSNVTGSPVTLTTNGVNSFSNVDFMDITTAGSANWNLSGIIGGSGNCGGCRGITFSSPVTQTWQGQIGGNWSTNLWTTRMPLPQDSVVINEDFQTGQTIIVDVPRVGGNINFTGVIGNPTLNISTNTAVYGSLTLVSGMTISGVADINLMGRGNFTINTAGIVLTCNVNFNSGPTANSYTLNSNLVSTGVIFFSTGTFNASTFNLTGRFSSVYDGYLSLGNGAPRIINMGSGVWTTNATNPASTPWNFNTITNLTLNTNTSTLNVNNPTTSNFTFAGGSLIYYAVNFFLINGSEGNFTISGNNTINNLTINSPNNIFFTNGSTTTCQQFNCNGATSGAIVLRSTVSNYQWFLNILQGYSCSNTDIKDSNAAGSAILP